MLQRLAISLWWLLALVPLTHAENFMMIILPNGGKLEPDKGFCTFDELHTLNTHVNYYMKYGNGASGSGSESGSRRGLRKNRRLAFDSMDCCNACYSFAQCIIAYSSCKNAPYRYNGSPNCPARRRGRNRQLGGHSRGLGGSEDIKDKIDEYKEEILSYENEIAALDPNDKDFLKDKEGFEKKIADLNKKISEERQKLVEAIQKEHQELHKEEYEICMKKADKIGNWMREDIIDDNKAGVDAPCRQLFKDDKVDIICVKKQAI